MRAVAQIINSSIQEIGDMTNLELLKFRGVLDSGISTKMNQQALLVDMCNKSVLEMEVEASGKGLFKYDCKRYINKVKKASDDMIVRNDKKYGDETVQGGFGELSDYLYETFDVASRMASTEKLEALLVEAKRLKEIPFNDEK